MRHKLTKAIMAFIGASILFILAPSFSDAQNLVSNGDFSAGLQGWTVVPTGETPPWPLVDGAVSLHPAAGGYTGTIIQQDLAITGVGGKTYSFSMKLLKTGTPDDAWRTVAVYLTYADNGNPVRYMLANPSGGDISTPVSTEGIPTFTGAVAASVALPATATTITRIEFAKEYYGDYTVDDIVLTEGSAAPCTFTVAKAGGVNPAIYLGYPAGTTTLNITASSSACPWSASVVSGGDWLSITGAASGTGNGQIQVAATANPSAVGIPRTASVSLGSGQGFMVLQLASPLPRSVVSLGPLQSVRAGNHTATMLQNGKTLIVGGYTNAGTTDVLATAEIYDPQTQGFTLTGSLHVPRWGHTATLLLDGKVLVAGGYNFQGGVHANLDTAELYDPATGQFTLLTSKMSAPRRQHTATAYPDPVTGAMKILLVGGITSGGAGPGDTWSVSSTADVFDPASGAFTAAGNLVSGRGTHWASLLSETRILIAGGSNFTNYLASAEIYDTRTGAFTSTGSMTTGRAHGIDGFQIVVGGGLTTGQTCLASTELFDEQRNAFSPYATLNYARRGHKVTPLSPGRLLVSGGDCAGNPTMEIFDLSTDAFTTASQPMTAPRMFHTATALPGASPESDILIVGGDAGGTAELYTTAPPANFALTVVKSGDGSGTATSAPAGIDCGAACAAPFSFGASVTLTAAAASGSTFVGWSGGGCSGTGTCTVTMDAAKTITATFTAAAQPPTSAPTLPRTGQTTCYDASGAVIACTGTGQDGEIQAGTAWPSPRFADNSNGTVTDGLTGLVWLKNAGCTGFGPFVPWLDALALARNLANGQCGLTDGSAVGDWRLPNINEIRSLTNTGQADGAVWLNTQGFSNVGTSYWSSTPWAQTGGYAWAVNIQTGVISGLGITPGAAAWPVRNGQSVGTVTLPGTGLTASSATGDDGDLQMGAVWPSPRFADIGDGTVKDTLTGLIWLKQVSCSPTKGWSDALTFAASLTSGQCSLSDSSQTGDWRVPNLSELLSLLDWSRLGPALPADHPFTEVVPNTYWTSTTQTSQTSNAWQVNLNTGIATSRSKTSELANAYVWPVRTGQQPPDGTMILAVAKGGTGTGAVTSAPTGVDCGAACAASFSFGASVTLTAAAASGSTFVGWSGGGCSGTGTCTVTMDAAKTVTATFQENVETAANAGPDSVVFDQAVLDGSGSQGAIVSWNWTLTHRTNSAWNRTATGQKPGISALEPGFYDVTLTVTDSASQTKTASMMLAVAGPWDVDKDGKQGLAEAIHLLQTIAGMR